MENPTQSTSFSGPALSHLPLSRGPSPLYPRGPPTQQQTPALPLSPLRPTSLTHAQPSSPPSLPAPAQALRPTLSHALGPLHPRRPHPSLSLCPAGPAGRTFPFLRPKSSPDSLLRPCRAPLPRGSSRTMQGHPLATPAPFPSRSAATQVRDHAELLRDPVFLAPVTPSPPPNSPGIPPYRTTRDLGTASLNTGRPSPALHTPPPHSSATRTRFPPPLSSSAVAELQRRR